MEKKVHDSLSSLEGVDLEVGEASLEMCLVALRSEFRRKGGSDNTVIERIFSLMSYLLM